MSVEATQSRTADTIDKYDHAIRLVDSTIPQTEQPQLTSNGSWRRVARNPTRTSLKHQLSQRKYAKWRQDKFDSDVVGSDRDEAQEPGTVGSSAAIAEAHPQDEESSTVDFAGPAPDTIPAVESTLVAPVKGKKEKNKSDYVIDILYENQRGSFFCGLPLYSHSSLLPIDPSAWVTHEFKDSPVNITNAQVPDPSWMWAWKTWYVDMSYDVDEEGWQYSFSFGSNFAWHGTHPWFHSFARRRRWLRKRVKRSDPVGRYNKEGTLEAAHHLNTDYFTIHSRPRDRSPASTSNPETQLARPVSFTSFQSIKEEYPEPDEIKDIPALMRAIRLANIDREKVDVVKKFIKDGGDELFYLQEKMPEIMSSLVFQNSRRQILEYLKNSAEEAREHRAEHDAEDRPEGEDEKRKIDNLLKAADAADEQIHGLEYWSDRKHVLHTEDEAIEGEDKDNDGQSGRKTSIIGEIKGISDKSETTREIRVDRRLMDKGKRPEEPIESIWKDSGTQQERTTSGDDSKQPEPSGSEDSIHQAKGTIRPVLDANSILVSDSDDD